MADESANAGGILGHLPPLPRKALNNSVIGMEQAYRQRKGLPALSDADIEALKAGQPMSCCTSINSCGCFEFTGTGTSGRCRGTIPCSWGWHQRGCCQVGCGGKEME
jgi:hypothetical protein